MVCAQAWICACVCAGLPGNGLTAFRFWLKITLRLAKRSGPGDTERDMKRKKPNKKTKQVGEMGVKQGQTTHVR